MKRLLLIILPLVMVTYGSVAWAQNGKDYTVADYEETLTTQGFGVHFGNVSGNGYAWRYMTDNNGIQLVLGGYTSGDNSYHFPSTYSNYESNPAPFVYDRDPGRKYYINFGANYIKPLKRTQYSLFYVHAGVNWNYSDQRIYTQKYVYETESGSENIYSLDDSPVISHKVKSYVNIGAGPGFELALGRYVKLALELPVTYTGKDEFLMYIPQAGLYYYFK